MTIDLTAAYGIDDGEGNALTRGVSGYRVASVAQNLANDLGKSVWYYQTGPGEEDSTPVEVAPARTDQ